jgi:hypothetical protein
LPIECADAVRAGHPDEQFEPFTEGAHRDDSYTIFTANAKRSICFAFCPNFSQIASSGKTFR